MEEHQRPSHHGRYAQTTLQEQLPAEEQQRLEMSPAPDETSSAEAAPGRKNGVVSQRSAEAAAQGGCGPLRATARPPQLSRSTSRVQWWATWSLTLPSSRCARPASPPFLCRFLMQTRSACAGVGGEREMEKEEVRCSPGLGRQPLGGARPLGTAQGTGRAWPPEGLQRLDPQATRARQGRSTRHRTTRSPPNGTRDVQEAYLHAC